MSQHELHENQRSHRRTPSWRRRLVVAAACAPALVVVARGAPQAAATSPSQSGAAHPGNVAAIATTLTVRMTEFALAPDKTALTPGSYVFHAINVGHVPHALELDGAGVEDKATMVLQPGQAADLPVTLSAGDLDLYCPVDDHRAMGMQLHLTVAPASAPGASGSGGGH